jgi:predicted DNA-binding transcriptional regulator YafY
LYRHTDEEHRLSQEEILDKLILEYDMKVDRKSITRNLLDLEIFLDGTGYELGYDVTIRNIAVRSEGGKSYVCDSETGERCFEKQEKLSNFYLIRPFEDSELRLLIDAIMFSMNITDKHRKELVRKICKLSNKNFKSRVKHIACINSGISNNQQIFTNIELIDEAINTNRKIKFNYIDYGTDKKAYLRKNKYGEVRTYKINPYQMAAKEGKYYLICNFDGLANVSNYRIDRIKNIEILDEQVKPFSELNESNGWRLDLNEYMKEHIYMYSSANEQVTFRIVRAMISDVVEIFGGDIRFMDETDTHVTVVAKVNLRAMFQFAKNYAPDVEVLKPESLRNEVKEELKKALGVYI